MWYQSVLVAKCDTPLWWEICRSNPEFFLTRARCRATPKFNSSLTVEGEYPACGCMHFLAVPAITEVTTLGCRIHVLLHLNNVTPRQASRTQIPLAVWRHWVSRTSRRAVIFLSRVSWIWQAPARRCSRKSNAWMGPALLDRKALPARQRVIPQR